MTAHNQQSGFVLLLMLFVLLGAGVSGLSQTHQGYRKATRVGFTADQYALQSARQALLTYAAFYPWFYGPRSAGPGHLPCPDTDAPTRALRLQTTSRDGPNPPCGANANPAGKLPRHVNLPGHRYVFHVEPYQRLEYSVSSDMINNPVNRIVNDAVIRGEPAQRPFIAWVRQPLEDTGESQSVISQVPVSRESLLPGVRRSVAAWLVREVNRERGEVCSLSAEWLSESASRGSTDLLSLIAHRIAEPVMQPSDHPVPALEHCLVYPAQDTAVEDRLIENVPLAAHWFVRNGWHERLVLQSSQACAAGSTENCLLVWDPAGSRTGVADERLYFTWQVTS